METVTPFPLSDSSSKTCVSQRLVTYNIGFRFVDVYHLLSFSPFSDRVFLFHTSDVNISFFPNSIYLNQELHTILRTLQVFIYLRQHYLRSVFRNHLSIINEGVVGKEKEGPSPGLKVTFKVRRG